MVLFVFNGFVSFVSVGKIFGWVVKLISGCLCSEGGKEYCDGGFYSCCLGSLEIDVGEFEFWGLLLEDDLDVLK